MMTMNSKRDSLPGKFKLFDDDLLAEIHVATLNNTANTSRISGVIFKTSKRNLECI